MLRSFQRSILPERGRTGLLGLAAGLLLALTGCSPGPLIDRLPGDMGLPAGTPARPVTPYEYPAVHDMPPPRQTAPLTEDEQLRMEKELQTVRDRQESREAPANKPAAAKDKTPPLAKKKQPAEANMAPPAGAKTNP